ncbi:MAG: hypothetical protein QM817_02235 [Archangium sp.]
MLASQLATAALWQKEDDGRGATGGAMPTPSSSPEQCTYDKDCPTNWTCQGYTELGDGQWSRGVCTAPTNADADRKARVRQSGQVTMAVGGILMGLGAAGFLIIGAASGGSLGWAYGGTFGVLVGGAGLIVLIIGALISAFA